MPFQTMVMNFGPDGLESEYPIHTSDDSSECYQKALDYMEDNPETCRVIEVDQAHKRVYTNGTTERPYPHVSEPEEPDFYLARLRQDKSFRWQRNESPWQKLDISKIDFSQVLVETK